MSLTILQGDWIEQLRTLPDASVHCCVTSPPYWGLRDYGVPGQLGLEKTPEEYVAKVVEGFREVWRVLRDDGTCWVNLGDCYQGGNRGEWGQTRGGNSPIQSSNLGSDTVGAANRFPIPGLKPKDLVGIPWRVAFALQADGWYLRSDIIWHKPNPMPESVTDRPTKSHEYIFLLSKSARYFYDQEAIEEAPNGGAHARVKANGANSRMILERAAGREHSKSNPSRSNIPGVGPKTTPAGSGVKMNESYQAAMVEMRPDRNKRTVWTVATAPYKEAHFATFPPDLIKPCILAGTSARGCCPKCGAPWERILETGEPFRIREGSDKSAASKQESSTGKHGDSSIFKTGCKTPTNTTGWQPTCECGETETVPAVVLDPFGGSFTTCAVAIELGRKAIGVELNPKYIELGRQRCAITPGLALA